LAKASSSVFYLALASSSAFYPAPASTLGTADGLSLRELVPSTPDYDLDTLVSSFLPFCFLGLNTGDTEGGVTTGGDTTAGDCFDPPDVAKIATTTTTTIKISSPII